MQCRNRVFCPADFATAQVSATASLCWRPAHPRSSVLSVAGGWVWGLDQMQVSFIGENLLPCGVVPSSGGAERSVYVLCDL